MTDADGESLLRASPAVREIDGCRDLLALAAANPSRYPFLLESLTSSSLTSASLTPGGAQSSGAQSRFDVLFAFPQRLLRLDHDSRVRDEHGVDRGAHFLAALDAAWRAEQLAAEHLPTWPFRGGWALFLGYELAQEIEPSLKLPRSPDSAIPIALALRCPAAIIVDRVARKTYCVAEREHAHIVGELADDLAAQALFEPMSISCESIIEDKPEKFLDGVARIQEYLCAGDVFQVNLSRQWHARLSGNCSAASLYSSLRRANPAPFAGLLQWQDWAIVSSSPERLVQVRGDTAQTRPIAGTRPRTPDDDDHVRRNELSSNLKERAEHIMLLDLERNDLGRICVPGSIIVDELMAVESYAHVHHIVSNVRGRVRAGTTPGDVMRATFPGGTITGCPKVRTMQIIAELEGVGRGSYTGSFGYLNRDGDMDLNILIRTLALHAGQVRFRAGAGIVVDSEADRELLETRAKARGLMHALGVRD